MMGLGLVQHKRHMIGRGLVQRSYVYLHVLQRCSDLTRPELHWRSMGSEEMWRRSDVVYRSGRYRYRWKYRWIYRYGFVTDSNTDADTVSAAD